MESNAEHQRARSRGSKPVGPKRLSRQLKSMESELAKLTSELQMDTEVSNKALVTSLMGPEGLADSKEQGEMRKQVCSQCGTKFKEDAKFCKRCGNRRPEEKKQKQHKIIPNDFFMDLSQEVDGMLKRFLSHSGQKEKASPFMTRPGFSQDEHDQRAQSSPPPLATDGDWGDATPRSATPRGAPSDTQTTIDPGVMESAEQPDLGESVLTQEDPSGMKQSMDSEIPRGALDATGMTEADTTVEISEQTEKSVGFDSWIHRREDKDAQTPKSPNLLQSSTKDLLEDLRGAESVTWSAQKEKEAEAEKAAAKNYVEEKHFWELDRDQLDEAEETQWEIEQAIWRLRKFLRKKFGTSENAWNALEEASHTVGQLQQGGFQARAADTLSFAEIKIALSRLGINLPYVTGYDKVKTLLQAIDDNGTRMITFKELLGEDDDPSNLHEEPGETAQTWETGLVQPRWVRLYDQGLFDKELEEHCITRDIHRPTRPKFEVKKTKKPDGYMPIYKRYRKVMEDRKAEREKLQRERRSKELVGCTFTPEIHRSKSMPANPQKPKERTEMTYRNRNLIEYLAKKRAEANEYTFTPKIIERSGRIIDLMRAEAGSAHERLAMKEVHDRMGHIEAVKAEANAMTPFWPVVDHDDRFKERDRSVPIHERLFHHDHHEYWHGHAHWHEKDKEDKSKSKGWSPDKKTPSTPGMLNPSDLGTEMSGGSSDEGDSKDVLTVEYRAGLLGLMEACERWGVHVNKEFAWALSDNLKAVGGKTPKSDDSKSPRSKKRGKSPSEQSLTGSKGETPEAGVKPISKARTRDKRREPTKPNPARQVRVS